MTDGFTVDRAALLETARGINDTIGALEGLGFDEEAGTGRGFSGLALSGLQVGYTGLQSAFTGFCDRWSWGVRTLVQDGNQFAQRLGLSAGMYAAAERSIIGSVKNLVDAGMGDPHLSDSQVAQGSWTQAEGLAAGQAPNDFSGAAWRQAAAQMGQMWQADARSASGDLKDVTDPGGR